MRLDIKAQGLWGCSVSRYSFDKKIFNQLAKTFPKNSVEAYKYNESVTRFKYEQRLLDLENNENISLVFSCIRGAGLSTTYTINQLASKIAEKKTNHSRTLQHAYARE